jgi:HEAT repeat protein
MDDVQRLAAELGSDDSEVRKAAALSLAQSGLAARGAAIELLRAVGDSDEAVREAAVAALEELGPPRVEDLEGLAGRLGAASADTAYWAATLIGRAGNEGAVVVSLLEAALRTRDEAAVRERIVWALGEIGRPAASATAAIEATEAAADCPPRLARLCREALQSIGARD